LKKAVTAMGLHLRCKRAIIGALLAGVTAMAGAPSKTIIESVKAMERERALTMMWHFDLVRSVRRTQQIPDNYSLFVSAISPDGTAIAWSSYPNSGPREKFPFLTVKSLKEGTQPVWVAGRVAAGSPALSSGAEVIVAIALPLDPLQRRRRDLLAIDRRSGVVVHDLTRFVTQFEVTTDVMSGNHIENICVSGPGTLVALGTREQMQVLEIPSGKTVYAGPGSCPRLSPDGNRLAFVDKDSLFIHSFADGATVQLRKVKRVKGVGGWSPDGRFLLVGAWTTLLAFEKRQIIVDTTTGEYAVIGKLSDGDYGTNFAWVSVKLLER
jgi:hypothetical protein